MSSKVYFHIKDLKINFKSFEGEKTVLDIDEIRIDRGKSYGIIGESGTGKTVLALSILKLLQMPPGRVVRGEISLEGENLLNMSQKRMQSEIRGKKISMIFQDPMSTLNPVFNIGDQIIKVIMENQNLNKRDAYSKAVEMINTVKLPDAENIMKKYPHELSGGQRQRVIIALALSCGAQFIIADEPTRNLDVTIQAGILKLIRELQKNLKVTVLFIANNPGLVSATCDDTAILYKGEIVERGKTREVLKNAKHPYTQMLLNAVPKNRKNEIDLNKLVFTEGNAGDDRKGCLYYDRCLKRQDKCRKKQELLQLGENHFVKCCLYKGDNDDE